MDDIVRLLVDKGVDVNEKDAYGRTPFYYALKTKKIELAKLLLDSGAEGPLGIESFLDCIVE